MLYLTINSGPSAQISPCVVEVWSDVRLEACDSPSCSLIGTRRSMGSAPHALNVFDEVCMPVKRTKQRKYLTKYLMETI